MTTAHRPHPRIRSTQVCTCINSAQPASSHQSTYEYTCIFVGMHINTDMLCRQSVLLCSSASYHPVYICVSVKVYMCSEFIFRILASGLHICIHIFVYLCILTPVRDGINSPSSYSRIWSPHVYDLCTIRVYVCHMSNIVYYMCIRVLYVYYEYTYIDSQYTYNTHIHIQYAYGLYVYMCSICVLLYLCMLTTILK